VLRIEVLHEPADWGNTVVVIDHNLEVIKTADWVIALGPEGRDDGGRMWRRARPRTSPRRKKATKGTIWRTYLAGARKAASRAE